MFLKINLEKILFIVAVLSASVGFFCLNAHIIEAATTAELQTLIIQLRTKIAEFQKELAKIQEQPEIWCHDFNRNLKYGNAGSEVRALQTALEKEGFYGYPATQSTDSRGSFGIYTSSAVVGFQEKYKEEILSPWGLAHGTGFVGSTTRKKLNEIYGCEIEEPVVSIEPEEPEEPVEKSITVISPNGGEQWVIGNTYDITWKSSGVSKVYVTLFNHSQTDSCRLIYESIADTGSYSFNTGQQGRCPQSVFIGDKIKIRVSADVNTTDGVEVKDESDNYFSIVEAPTCADTDGGKDYYVKGSCVGRPNIYTNETKTLTDYCITPRSDYNYNLIEYSCGYVENVLICDSDAYKCPYGCSDGACCKQGITVISPNGGEEWVIGNTYDITWSSEEVQRVYINLLDSNSMQAWVVGGIQASLGKYAWTIPANIQIGDHSKIIITQEEEGFFPTPQDYSDNYFSIKTCEDRSCNYIIVNYLETLFTYDVNFNKVIDDTEAQSATYDQINNQISKGQMCAITNAWQKDCIIPEKNKTCSLSGYNWTDIRASKTACDNYCKDIGYSESDVTDSGSKTCAGAQCSYISDFSTCSQSEVWNDGHCGCANQFTCQCEVGGMGLKSIENQLASVSGAISQLAEKIKELMK